MTGTPMSSSMVFILMDWFFEANTILQSEGGPALGRRACATALDGDGQFH
jgi:hypothetical protein